LFYSSYLFLGKLRSIGVSNLPMAIRVILSKSTTIKSSTGKESVRNSSSNRSSKDRSLQNRTDGHQGLDDKTATPSTTTTTTSSTISWDELCNQVWTYLQASSVLSGLLNVYPHVVIKWNAMFHIVLVVKESIEHRYATQLEKERLAREREAKRQSILQFWRRWLPKFLFEWIFLRKEKTKLNDHKPVSTATTTTNSITSNPASRQPSSFVGAATSATGFLRQRKTTSTASTSSTSLSSSSSFPSSSTPSLPSNQEIRHHIQKAKLVVQGQRESAIDDLIWGALQIALIYYDWTHWQTLVMAWMIFLLTVLEEAWLDESLTSEKKWRKAMWIAAAAIATGKLAFF
jgi:hypothetical protein